MKFAECAVQGARVIEPEPHLDERGRFARAWCRREFEAEGVDFVPVQENCAYSSRKGTLRGLHAQIAPAPEAKLVRCTRGEVFDVVVDLREDSPTYLRWHATTLGPENGRMLYLPAGCAHGCLSLRDDSEISYLTNAFYTPDAVRGARFDDPAIGIDWPIPVSTISDQDAGWPLIGRTA